MAAPLTKIILFTFNFLFFVLGSLLLSFGIVGVANPTALANFLWWIPGVKAMAVIINIPSVIISCATFMIVLGSILVVFGFFGCAGVLFNSKWMLFIYWILICLLIIVEVALIIFAAVSPTTMATKVQKVMLNSLEKSFDPVYISGTSIRLPSNLVSVAWVSMQFEVGCCGVNNASDYSSFSWNRTINLPSGSSVSAKIPPSCCVLSGGKEVPNNTVVFQDLSSCLELQSNYYTEGCYSAVHHLIVQYSFISIGICIAVIVIQSFAMAMAIYLWRLKTPKHDV